MLLERGAFRPNSAKMTWGASSCGRECCSADRSNVMTALRIALLTVLISVHALAQSLPPLAPLPSAVPPFDAWLEELRAEAVSRGISTTLIEKTLTGLQPVEQV